jgi:hypothetical protein
MTNYGFRSDAEKLSENDEQVEDQAATESQARQRWVLTQLLWTSVVSHVSIKAPQVLRRLNPRSSLLLVDPHGQQARHLKTRSSTLYITC